MEARARARRGRGPGSPEATGANGDREGGPRPLTGAARANLGSTGPPLPSRRCSRQLGWARSSPRPAAEGPLASCAPRPRPWPPRPGPSWLWPSAGWSRSPRVAKAARTTVQGPRTRAWRGRRSGRAGSVAGATSDPPSGSAPRSGCPSRPGRHPGSRAHSASRRATRSGAPTRSETSTRPRLSPATPRRPLPPPGGSRGGGG